MVDENKHENGRWLYEKYHTDGLNLREIAELTNVSKATIHRKMEEYGIGRRDSSISRMLAHQEPYKLHTDNNGYEVWKPNVGDVLVHRLAAVAWFGFDAIKEKDIHHIDGVPWHNAEYNLEPKSREEHMRDHTTERVANLVRDEAGRFVYEKRV